MNSVRQIRNHQDLLHNSCQLLIQQYQQDMYLSRKKNWWYLKSFSFYLVSITMTSWNRLYVSIHITFCEHRAYYMTSMTCTAREKKEATQSLWQRERANANESNEQDLHKAPLFEQFVWMKMSLGEDGCSKKINDDTRHAFRLSKISDVMVWWERSWRSWERISWE
jgi:hypothetical protein